MLDVQSRYIARQIMADRYGLISRLSILAKSGALVEMQYPYPEQMEVAKAWFDYDSILILKARQCGITSILMALIYDRIYRSLDPRRMLVVADCAETNAAQWGKLTLFNSRLPKILARPMERSNRKELIFGDTLAGARVLTAGGGSMGTGWTYQDIFLDEFAKWPEAQASDVYGSVTSTQVKTKGSKTVIASTPNGPGNLFHEKCIAASEAELKGIKTGTKFIFLPWFINPDYVREPYPGWEPTHEEWKHALEYGLSPEQIYWKHWKINDPVDGIGRKRFKREYPETEEDGFIVLEGSWFDIDPLNALLKGMRRPNDEIRIYHTMEPGELYCAGIDGAWCNGGDFAVLQILDSTGRQCAVFSTNEGGELRFAMLASELLALYGRPLTLVEGNPGGAGINIMRVLKEDGHRMWYQRKGNTKQVKNFYTSRNSKMQVLSHLRQESNAGVLELNDQRTVKEMIHLREERGTIEGRDGNHDDEVIALALANWARQRIAGKAGVRRSPSAPTTPKAEKAFIDAMAALRQRRGAR